jgi:hypothetical protein
MKINHNTTTRIPVNDDYAAILGKAVYLFAYYEWIIIYIIEYLDKGFVSEYSRPTKRPLTSGSVNVKLKETIAKVDFSTLTVDNADLEQCQQEFENLIDKRNALIHAHPITDKDGSQILAYQARPSKAISDMTWKLSEIESLIKEIDATGVKAGKILDEIRKADNTV